MVVTAALGLRALGLLGAAIIGFEFDVFTV